MRKSKNKIENSTQNFFKAKIEKMNLHTKITKPSSKNKRKNPSKVIIQTY